jgi:hypothetical protein
MPFCIHARYRGRSSPSELQPFGFPSTLVLLKTRFRVVVLYSLVKEPRGLLRPPTEAAKRGLEAFVNVRRRDSVFLRWSVRDSNPRPPACKAGALPAELTPQESLGAICVAPPQAVGLERFELSTPRLSSVCSNQLSYRPRFCFVEQSPHQAIQ